MKRVHQYISGDLSEEEFEKISEDLIVSKLDRDKKRIWSTKLKEEYGVVRGGRSKPFFKRKKYFIPLAIAASCLLLLSVFLLQSLGDEPYMKLVDEHIAHLDIMANQNLMRKGEQVVEETRKAANLSYAKADYETSILLWERLVSTNLANEMDYFYLALSYLQKASANPDKSITYLLKSRALEGPEAEISWCLSLAYLKAGEIKAGEQELRGILRKNAYKGAEASALLDRLKNENF